MKGGDEVFMTKRRKWNLFQERSKNEKALDPESFCHLCRRRYFSKTGYYQVLSYFYLVEYCEDVLNVKTLDGWA
jgi:hypothetical protein